MALRVEFTPTGWEDYCHWKESDPGVVERIHELIKDIGRDPFKGLGKPEPLRHDLAGYWSRRITGEHRLVHAMTGDKGGRKVTILMCRYHYDH
ncbi:MAG TPA: Txe/YoeB family addiction module toxin [Flavobacteriales bacterium]|nr:Txe/YoeB family addiction module toxin [Flavobacteriales bacterium]